MNKSVKELQDLEQKLDEINHILDKTTVHVEEERKHGPAIESDLNEQLAAVEKRDSSIRKEIKKAKEYCKIRKTEIEDWRQWFGTLSKIDKSEELMQMNGEIEWRIKDIADKEIAISNLYIQLLHTEGETEQLKIRLEALRFENRDTPVEEDSRIKSIKEEKDKTLQKINILKRES
eukprot:gnl/Carplike_NY0171/1594_a2154_708.p1 GENE.gnl/Carplike_NY0171/1594_a2154_708~~gnl/Carplike_NY0171/1594_a2154_708.p1  ORF type:complete len:176 (+),score=15.30 gnl/Carplike_NY0171/1594_a2154_708:17-544(+)